MSEVFDPLTPAAGDARYLHERYLEHNGPSPALRAFYAIKPAIPRSVQIALRRRLARRQARREFPAWPIEPVLLQGRRRALVAELARRGSDRVQIVAPWPAPHRFAISLTHDVEGPLGIQRIPCLLELERKYGFVSSWNFVAEWYPLTEDVLQMVREAGCEVGMHGITHDGALFRDRASFEASLPKIRAYMESWHAVGFRSPSTLRNAMWMHELPVSYDTSFPDSDPFQPQAGGCCWIFPFLFGDVVELPMTLDQDHTLFILLKETSIRRWIDKCRWIIDNGGLINVNVHPDYMDGERLGRYEQLLQFLSEQDGGWRALPRDIAAWWHDRAALCKRLPEGKEDLAAAVNGRATAVWARLERERIVYEH